ncbi:MAG: HAD family hydrolase [Pseudomonadota bacterium]
MNIAMWSGPRNLSTALMYAFAQRADTSVRDEPFYAAYLHATEADHPMRDAVLRSQPTSFEKVASACAAPAAEGTAHLYLKLMAHHMVADAPLGFMAACTNVFLIRHPARVLASYAVKREHPMLEDIGAARLLELYGAAQRLGQAPIVIDAADIRRDPAGKIAALCTALGLAPDPTMLHWPMGGNAADGVWAPHWYGAVHRSTGFAAAEGPLPEVSAELRETYAAALLLYEEMAQSKL